MLQGAKLADLLDLLSFHVKFSAQIHFYQQGQWQIASINFEEVYFVMALHFLQNIGRK